MTSDEQEYGSRKYIAPRLTILPLTSGRIAVGARENPFNLLQVFDTPDLLLQYVRECAEENLAASQQEAERASRTIVPLFEINLDDLDLDLDITL